MERRGNVPQASDSMAKLTYDDLVQMFPDEDNVHRELIDGELFVTPSPSRRHQRLVLRMSLSLGHHLETHPEQGELFVAPFDTVMTPFDVVEPDLLVVLADQSGILTEKNVQGAPGLVIEVLSPSTRKRDLTLKRQLFDREGVREYWMIDPDRNEIVVHRRAVDGSFPIAASFTAGTDKTLTTNLLPGWGLSVDQLFR
jgi:Uma2 family endonuclease